MVKTILSTLYLKFRDKFRGHGIEKIFPLNYLHQGITKLLKSNNSVVDGHIMYLDQDDSLLFSVHHTYEELETEIIKREVKSGDIVIDLGAHIGYHTLLFARQVGTKGKVYSFEPAPSNFKLLEKNVAANKYSNIKLINKAVANKVKKIPFYLSDNNQADHRIFKSDHNQTAVNVDCTTLDAYFKNISYNCQFMKMDIQGAELEALKGMKNLVKTNNKLQMIIEYWPIGLKEYGTKPVDLLKILKDYGFDLYDVGNAKREPELIDIPVLLKKYSPLKDEYTNLWCVKK